MATAYEQQLQQPKLHDIDFDSRLAMLVEAEASAREDRKLKRLIGSAGLPELASLEAVDYLPGRGLDKGQIAAFGTCEWVRRHQNLVIVGATGVGKTWLACAIALQACRIKMSVVFYRASALYEAFAEAIHAGSLPKLKQALNKPDILIIDDFGLGSISGLCSQILLDVVDRRMRSGSLLITSQFPTDEWHRHIPDPTIAEAIFDRVVHQAHRLELKGESMRKVRARKNMGQAS
jgi:DNA replication protein DnaC